MTSMRLRRYISAAWSFFKRLSSLIVELEECQRRTAFCEMIMIRRLELSHLAQKIRRGQAHEAVSFLDNGRHRRRSPEQFVSAPPARSASIATKPHTDPSRSWNSVPIPTCLVKKTNPGRTKMQAVAGPPPTTIGVGSRGKKAYRIPILERGLSDTKTANQAYSCLSACSKNRKIENGEETSFLSSNIDIGLHQLLLPSFENIKQQWRGLEKGGNGERDSLSLINIDIGLHQLLLPSFENIKQQWREPKKRGKKTYGRPRDQPVRGAGYEPSGHTWLGEPMDLTISHTTRAYLPCIPQRYHHHDH